MVPPLLRRSAMRSLVAVLILAGCSGASGARDAEPDAGSADAGAGDSPDSGAPDAAGPPPDAGSDPRVRCAPGSTLRTYSLSPIAPLPSRSDLELPGLPATAQIISAGTGQTNSARFDVCDDGAGGSVLEEVLFVGETFETPRLYRVDETISAPVEEVLQIDEGLVVSLRLPPADVAVSGLDEALAGHLQPLEIRLVNDSGLLIVGHDGFVAVARGRVGPASITYTTSSIVVGGLTPGDVFAGLACHFGEEALSTAFTMGTADFELDACTFQGAGFTAGYRITRLSVQDSNAALTAAEQGRFELVGEAEVEASLAYVYNHHNACDSFHLALPHADYAATTAPAAGCGAPVPDAPMRDINEDSTSPVKYRIRYHGGEWMDGTIPGCSHYLFCH